MHFKVATSLLRAIILGLKRNTSWKSFSLLSMVYLFENSLLFGASFKIGTSMLVETSVIQGTKSLYHLLYTAHLSANIVIFKPSNHWGSLKPSKLLPWQRHLQVQNSSNVEFLCITGTWEYLNGRIQTCCRLIELTTGRSMQGLMGKLSPHEIKIIYLFMLNKNILCPHRKRGVAC